MIINPEQAQAASHKRWYVTYFTVVFPFFIILAQYRTNVGVASYGLNIIYFGVLLAVAQSRRIQVHRDLLLFTIIYSLMEGYNLISRGIDPAVTANRLIGPFLMILSISTISLTIVREKFLQYYEWVVIVTSVGIIYHSATLQLSDGLVTTIAILPSEHLELFARELDRPTSFFTEPQAYASFVLPMYVYYLVTHRFLRAMFLVAVLIISTSSFGLLCSAILALAYGFMFRDKYGYVVPLTGVFAAFYLTITYTALGQQAFDKILSTEYNTSIRTGKGLQLFLNLSTREQMFGITSTVTDYIVKNIGDFSWAHIYIGSEAEHLLEYLTTTSYFLVNFGILGLVIYFVFLYRLYYSCRTNLSRLLFLMVLIANFSNTVLFNAWFIFYYVLIYMHNRDSGLNPNIVRVSLKWR